MTREPLVSVAMTAYNAERWIGRAMQSVLDQQTGFPIELVVADDCSQDGTAAVVRGYQDRYPEVIRLLGRSSNLGMQRNFYDTFEQCRGRYIAWLDADDLWTDPQKLELQVGALEADPTLSVCGHFVRFEDAAGETLVPRYPRRPAGRYTLGAVIAQNFIPSPSIVFRAGIHRELSDWFFALPGVTDWPILLLSGLHGDFLLLDRVMAVYNAHGESAYNGKGALHQYTVDREVLECMPTFLPKRWQREIQAGLGRHFESLSYSLRKQGEYSEARRVAWQALSAPRLTDNLPGKLKCICAALLAEGLAPRRSTSESR